MELTIYQIDAFADQIFAGNPAAVVPLKSWLPDELMQQIAAENNLSETAFYVPDGAGFHIRWFTPAIEVDLCGHATLASAYVLYEFQEYNQPVLHFNCRVGPLAVRKTAEGLCMDFPADTLERMEPPAHLAKALGTDVIDFFRGREDFLAIVDSEATIRTLRPDLRGLAQLQARGLLVSAPGIEKDFVSRCFFPQSGVDEDPVTGSAHTTMTPYWAQRLGKTKLEARQLSARGGNVRCELVGDRVLLTGNAHAYLRGTIFV
ncbi:MAG: PhzF family phenazine biosynthesis protein [Bacteroidota bacterium]